MTFKYHLLTQVNSKLQLVFKKLLFIMFDIEFSLKVVQKTNIQLSSQIQRTLFYILFKYNFFFLNEKIQQNLNKTFYQNYRLNKKF